MHFFWWTTPYLEWNVSQHSASVCYARAKLNSNKITDNLSMSNWRMEYKYKPIRTDLFPKVYTDCQKGEVKTKVVQF